jgi:hypothetical protein
MKFIKHMFSLDGPIRTNGLTTSVEGGWLLLHHWLYHDRYDAVYYSHVSLRGLQYDCDTKT